MEENKQVELFDSSKFIDEDTQIKFRLKRKNGIVPSPWEIGNLVDNLSSYYYKMELLNVISQAISNDVSPKNIFILDESFKLNQSYSNLDTMSISDTQIKNLYSIGLPISLYSNKNIFMLHMIFKTFRLCNEKIYEHKKKYVNRDEISIHTKAYFIEQKLDTEVIEHIVDNAISFMKKRKPVQSSEVEKKVISNLYAVKDEMLKELEQYKLDELEMPTVEKMLYNFDSYKDKKELTESTVYRKYYKKFLYLINKVSRPVVCIYYDETNQIQILSLGHINKNKRKNTFFDVKSISHNSPFLGDFITGAVSGVCTIVKTKDEIDRNNEIHEYKLRQEELNTKILESQIKKVNAEAETAELEKIIKQIELSEKINEISKKHGGNPAKFVSNPYLKNQVSEAYNTIQNSSQRLLGANKLEIIDIEEIQHIDTTV